MTPNPLNFSKIVHETEPVVLVGGGTVDLVCFQDLRKHSSIIVAADGGANWLVDHGIIPNAVIGDLDSIDPKTRLKIPEDRVFHIAEQDSTDFDKALRSIEAPLILGIGFCGARVDHQLAAFNTLVRHPQQICILVDTDDIILRCPRELNLDLPEGTRVSLFPMGPTIGTSQGLYWPIDGIPMHPADRVGTSNMATGPISLRLESDKMLLILPRACLNDVIQQVAPLHAAGLARGK